jgi:hypothetical protein
MVASKVILHEENGKWVETNLNWEEAVSYQEAETECKELEWESKNEISMAIWWK